MGLPEIKQLIHSRKGSNMDSPITAVFSQEVMAAILQKLADVESAMSEGIALRPVDRRKMLKLGRKTTQFVQRTIEMADRNPSIVPSYVNRVGMNQNYQAYNQMLGLLDTIEQVKRKVEDRMYYSGSQSHSAAMSCYKAIKAASEANVPGAEPAYAALKTRFKPGKRKTGNDPGGEMPETEES